MASDSSSNDNVKLTTYRQYVMKHLPTEVSPEYEHVDILLAFASEYYDGTGGTGLFKATWGGDVTFENLTDLKLKYPRQVRVIISIGGFGSNYPFDPSEKESWIHNAVDSINKIISDYPNLIDGIDIHYDVIKPTVSKDDFSNIIGDVIKQLKKNKSITVVSIAPFKVNKPYYEQLYWENKRNITYVDYQFYNDKFGNWEDIVNLYEDLKKQYAPTDFLLGINKPPTYVFEQAFKYLVKNQKIPGYFVWNADGIALGSDPFSIEEIIPQNL